ncbi:uncharacterized protein LOC123644747 isoform X4 [Lemur catta]|uniref:uncharacterized protein LOC123644747 isoform X4 n=1 Tax=Lemur catta TaxID=9447 RepID=UPI001E2673B5|nr:uncharacterized protein LOC123644747 isoform X4 [Lemur catta]
MNLVIRSRGWSLHSGIVRLRKRPQRPQRAPSPSPPREDAACAPGKQTPPDTHLPAPLPWTPSLQDCERELSSSHPVARLWLHGLVGQRNRVGQEQPLGKRPSQQVSAWLQPQGDAEPQASRGGVSCSRHGFASCSLAGAAAMMAPWIPAYGWLLPVMSLLLPGPPLTAFKSLIDDLGLALSQVRTANAGQPMPLSLPLRQLLWAHADRYLPQPPETDSISLTRISSTLETSVAN